MDVHNGTSKFDIGMFMFEKPEGLVCNVEYSTEVFDASTIQRLLSALSFCSRRSLMTQISGSASCRC